MRPRRGAGCDPGVLVRQESRCGQDQKAPGLERDSGHSSRPHYRDQVAVDPAAGAGRFDRRAGCDRRGAVARIAKLLNISRHCEERSDEAIQLQTRRTMDCFAALAMTGRKFDSNFKQQICFRVLAARLARGLHVVVPQKREQGMPDARCTRGPVCKWVEKTHTSIQVQRRAIRHSLRNGFTAYFALSPEYRAFLPPSPHGNRHSGPVGLSHLR